MSGYTTISVALESEPRTTQGLKRAISTTPSLHEGEKEHSGRVTHTHTHTHTHVCTHTRTYTQTQLHTRYIVSRCHQTCPACSDDRHTNQPPWQFLRWLTAAVSPHGGLGGMDLSRKSTVYSVYIQYATSTHVGVYIRMWLQSRHITVHCLFPIKTTG